MSRIHELRDTLIIGDRKPAALYHRIFVVSAYAGMTDELLESRAVRERLGFSLILKPEADFRKLLILERIEILPFQI